MASVLDAEPETKAEPKAKRRKYQVDPTDGMRALHICMGVLGQLNPDWRDWALTALANWPGPERQTLMFEEGSDAD